MRRDAAAELLNLPDPVNKRKNLPMSRPSVHRPAFEKNTLKQSNGLDATDYSGDHAHCNSFILFV